MPEKNAAVPPSTRDAIETAKRALAEAKHHMAAAENGQTPGTKAVLDMFPDYKESLEETAKPETREAA